MTIVSLSLLIDRASLKAQRKKKKQLSLKPILWSRGFKATVGNWSTNTMALESPALSTCWWLLTLTLSLISLQQQQCFEEGGLATCLTCRAVPCRDLHQGSCSSSQPQTGCCLCGPAELTSEVREVQTASFSLLVNVRFFSKHLLINTTELISLPAASVRITPSAGLCVVLSQGDCGLSRNARPLYSLEQHCVPLSRGANHLTINPRIFWFRIKIVSYCLAESRPRFPTIARFTVEQWLSTTWCIWWPSLR